MYGGGVASLTGPTAEKINDGCKIQGTKQTSVGDHSRDTHLCEHDQRRVGGMINSLSMLRLHKNTTLVRVT